MPQLTFIVPHALWLLLLLVPVWALALLGPRRLPRLSFWISLLLRSVAVVCLILALAGAQLVRPVARTTTLFLLDGSDSVSLSQRARAEAFIQEALAAMPSDDRAGILVFGARALVERPPSGDRSLGQVLARPGGGTTNIEDALRLGLALLPAEGHRRLVLLSDGGENAGDARIAARLAAAHGVPIDIVSLSGLADGPDVQVSGVTLPASAREGQRLRLRVDLESNLATEGRLTVEGPGGAIFVDQRVEVPGDGRALEVVLPEALPYFNRYVVRVEVPGDVRPENNAAEAYTFVSGRPRILLVAGDADAAANLAGALQAAQYDVITLEPHAMPAGLADLSAFDAVVLVDVPRRMLAERTQAALSAYVHDLGRGLLMVGGPQSFGAGGWRDTPVEAALPVTMDIPAQVRFPPVSIVVLIDISGSMAEIEEGGRTKIELAAHGAQQIAALLRDEDELTVIPFDDDAEGVVGPIPGTRRDEAIEALSRIQPGGGGINIHDGLQEAARYIRASDRPVRHIITITDGSDTAQQEGALSIVRSLRDEGVTVTSIAVGDGPHVSFISSMARVGGGRTFLTERASDVPSILAGEAEVVLQSYLFEETFTPERGLPHPVLRGVEQAPRLHGYVMTTPRDTAQVLLWSPRGDPVLAVWQYGLGRAAAWTSDLQGQWGIDWVRWEQFPRFSAQLLSWLLPSQSDQHLMLEASSSGAVLVLEAHARSPDGAPRTGLHVTAQLLDSRGVALDVPLSEVGPGRYRAAVSDAPPGAYLVQATARDEQGAPYAAVTAGAVVPQSAEYRSRGANPALLEAISSGTGGRIDPAPALVFDPVGSAGGAVQEVGLPLLWLALLLLPLDVGVRRLVRGVVRVPAWRAALAEVRPQARARAAAPRHRGPPGREQSAELERLRAAQEQARRRARGEE